MDAVGSAMKKLEESGQIMDQKTVETMIRKEIAEHGSGGYYGTYFLTLAASGWEQADEESPDYSYIYTAELPDSTSASFRAAHLCWEVFILPKMRVS